MSNLRNSQITRFFPTNRTILESQNQCESITNQSSTPKKGKLVIMDNNWTIIKLSKMIDWSRENQFPTQKRANETKAVASKRAQQKEREFGNAMIRPTRNGPNDNTSQWTTTACESFVAKVVTTIYPGRIFLRPNHDGLKPDFETDDAFWEVKAQTWTCDGTADEKIFAVPWKYCEMVRTHSKPLFIVLVAKQEYQARKKFGMFSHNMSKGKQKMINLWAKQNIYFVPFTHILNRYVAKGVQSRNACRR